jgi:GNAT superfamily N-acetyltransferase
VVTGRTESEEALSIKQAESREDIEAARRLFEEYAASLGFDLSFQDFEHELASLPGEYTPPEGRLLLAMLGKRVAGCVALRKLGERLCEMKRLFVGPTFRGHHIGEALVETVIREARDAGYTTMRLDTVPFMQAARSLYRKIGFKDILPYRFNPIPGAIYMELSLTGPDHEAPTSSRDHSRK